MTTTDMTSSPDALPGGGPLKKCTDLPVYTPRDGGDCLRGHKGSPLFSFLQAYRTLGPIFRCRFVGTDVVMMGGLRANEVIWGNNDYWDYHRSNAHFREQFNDRYLNQLEGAEFYKKRRRTVQGFKPSVLLAQTPGMSRVLFEEIDALRGERVEMRIFSMRLYICMTARVLM
ncbi:MAG TPA: hypothetical protein VFE31_13030, partial [Opitutaceae bacterium]|nr:hypothetical protein [Opitutaceae bacterium]